MLKNANDIHIRSLPTEPVFSTRSLPKNPRYNNDYNDNDNNENDNKMIIK